MITSTIFLLATGLMAPQDETVLPPTYALRVGKAETISGGTVEHAVVLVEAGKITIVGEDLPVERGIPIIDHPDWVLTPGFVLCHSRMGLGGQGSSSSEPQAKASVEVLPTDTAFSSMLEAGVTTVAFPPAGTGIPGQAVAVKPRGATREELILRDPAYLKAVLRSDAKSKRMLMEGFEKADEHEEKVKKAREAWEKEQEKSKKAKPKKGEEEKKDEKKEEADKKKEEESGKDEKKASEEKDEKAQEKDKAKEKEGAAFVPPAADPKVQPFLDLRSGKLSALFAISKAADYLHLLDALGDEKISYSVLCGLREDIDLFEVAKKFGETGGRIVLEPAVTFQPWTRRDRNIPAEFVAAGAKLALVPNQDSQFGLAHWRGDAGYLVRAGLDRQAALRALTLEPAEVLGLAERLGSIEAGKDANLILFDGDPLEPTTKVRMVILEGKNVYEYEPPYSGGEQ